MPRRLQIRVETGDLATAQEIRAALRQALAGQDLLEQAADLLPPIAPGGPHLVFLDVRARQGRAAADAIRAAIRGQIRAGGQLAGAERVVISGHECSHGTGDPRPCAGEDVEDIPGPAAGKRRSP